MANNIDYSDTIEKEANITVDHASEVAQGYLDKLKEAKRYKEDNKMARKLLNEWIDTFVSQPSIDGNADDFHNLAVDLAREDEYSLACKVLSAGIRQYKRNVDLLSDFISYGIQCDRLDECKKYYKTLQKISRRRWTWRGYAFSVTFLIFMVENHSISDKDDEKKRAEMLELIKDYRLYKPKSEDSYRLEARVYSTFNELRNEMDILEVALNSEEVILCPRCALRLADILVEQGDYEKARIAIQRSIDDSNTTNGMSNDAYLYYLSGITNLAILQRSHKELAEEDVLKIYEDFETALANFKSSGLSYLATIKNKTQSLAAKSGISVPDTCKKLSLMVNV